MIKGCGRIFAIAFFKRHCLCELVEAAERVVSQGKAKSRNEFVAQALQHELAALKRAEIDAALAQMAQDPEYQAQVLKMETEFATASWEALHLGEYHATQVGQAVAQPLAQQ